MYRYCTPKKNNHKTKKIISKKLSCTKRKSCISCYTKHVKISYQWVLQWWKIVLSEKKSLKIFDKKYLCSIIKETIHNATSIRLGKYIYASMFVFHDM